MSLDQLSEKVCLAKGIRISLTGASNERLINSFGSMVGYAGFFSLDLFSSYPFLVFSAFPLFFFLSFHSFSFHPLSSFPLLVLCSISFHFQYYCYYYRCCCCYCILIVVNLLLFYEYKYCVIIDIRGRVLFPCTIEI